MAIRHTCLRRRPMAAALSVLLLSSAAPGWAADPVCLDFNGNPLPASSTNQGLEGTTGENATCNATASAYGYRNNAGSASDSAFGYQNAAIGTQSSAIGYSNTARGFGGSAVGARNRANGAASTAFGYDNVASDLYGVAVGYKNQAIFSDTIAIGSNNIASLSPFAVAVGHSNNASGVASAAVGYFNTVNKDNAGAFGALNSATGRSSVAFGTRNNASGVNSSAVGSWYDVNSNGTFDPEDRGNTASIAGASAFSTGNTASGAASSAFGYASTASGATSSAFGYQAQALRIGSTAIGYQAVADRDYAVSVGSATAQRQIIHLADGTQATDAVNLRQLNAAMADAGSPYFAANTGFPGYEAPAEAVGLSAIAIGNNSHAGTNGTHFSIALGGSTQSYGYASMALGAGATVTSFHGMAIGVNANTTGAGAVAIGTSSVAAEDQVISFGHGIGDPYDYTLVGGGVGTYTNEINRRLIHVAAGIADTDAVNLSQLHPFATALGGGASFSNGVFAPPAYGIQGTSYGDVGAAFAAVDAQLTSLGGQAGTPGPTGPQGPQGPTGPQGAAGPGNPLSAAYDDAAKSTMTLQGAEGTRVTNIAAGTTSTDAVNKGQMDAGDAVTLQSARGYTDSRMTAFDDRFDALRKDVDQRLGDMDERIDRIGAMGGAMSAAAMNTAGLDGANRVGIGVGAQGGEAALAVGYQRLVHSRMSVSLSAGFSGGDNSVAAGTGFSW